MSQHGNHQRGKGKRGRGWWKSRGFGGRGRGGFQSSHHLTSRHRQTTLYDVPSPYKGWKTYFPEEIYSDNNPVVMRTKVFEKFFNNFKHQYNKDEIERNCCFFVDFKEMLLDQDVEEGLPELASEIRKTPESNIDCMGLAMYQMLCVDIDGDNDEDLSLGSSQYQDSQSTQVTHSITHILPKLHCRLLNFEPVTPLKNLKANYYGKFVSIKGTVVRVSNIKPLCTKLAFECTTCSTVQAMSLPDGKYVLPTSCSSTECRGRSFTPKRSHPLTKTIDWQTISCPVGKVGKIITSPDQDFISLGIVDKCHNDTHRIIQIQEIINDDKRESGRIPRTVDCEFMHDLVDSCVPGDQVTVSGIVKVQNTQEGGGKQKDKCMFLLYIHANSVNNAKGSKSQGQVNTGVAMEFTMKELYAIEEIQAEENLFRLLIHSLCPSIYGHELVKAGLILGLLGGSHKYQNDKNRIPVRGDPHILVVGDPGLGKSQMLQAAANIAPRSVYVCGNTTTTSGLTVTLSKEGGGSGDYALEAGALVLADQGCCCIDEFDKMGNQHQALLEAMEQQSISIAKAGIVCSLPARTSIIAAANPVGGHYNKAKTVSENLRMGSALLSRFDLVFILLDKPDEEMDSLLSEHVMALHAGRIRTPGSTPSQQPPQTPEEALARKQWESQKPLSERLKMPRTQAVDAIPPVLLRKYVAYARKYVHPKITPEAAQILQKFYLDLRRQHQTQDSTPITTRQLESLIRLTEARARVDLREECLEQDAQDVIEIMRYSMIDTYTDDMGIVDFARSQHGSGMSRGSMGKKFVAVLQRIYDHTYNSLFTMQEMRELAQQARIQVRNFEEFISSLNNQGFLLKKGPRLYQLQTAGY